jgi:ABC-type Fe3+-hydroxamate transport system substrate-binding protein
MREVFCEAIGKAVILPEKCEKIVSFSPSITEALFEMGIGSKIVGVSVYCVRPEEARKKVIVGSYSTFKKEKLKELNPDIIFTTTGYQLEFAKKLSEDFPVYAIRLPTNLADVISTCCEAGLVAGYYEQARKLEKKLLSKIHENISDLKNDEEKKISIYVEIDLGGPITFGAYSYITDTLELLGFKNIFGQIGKEWLKPDEEYIKEKNPEIIIYEPKMFSKRRDKNEIIEKLTKRFGKIKAIEDGNVFITPGIYDFLAHHGPSLINEVIPWLKEIKRIFLIKKKNN